MDTIVDEGKGASPQAEDGHIDIANEIAEALAKIQLSGNEWRMLWVIFRKTYGWHKKMDRISVTQFQKATNLQRRHVSRALLRLVKKCIVTKIGDTFITTYGFQKDYTKWKTVTQNGDDAGKSRLRGQAICKKSQTVTNFVPKPSPKLVHTKETTKEKTWSVKKTTDPRVKEFLNFWGETFLQKTGLPYVFSFGKEGRLIKDLLQVHSLETLQEIIISFFKDEQCKRRGLTVGIFFQEINRLISLRVMNPLEQAKKELGWKGG